MCARALASTRFSTIFLALSLTGCAQVLGLGDYKDGASGGAGGSGGSGVTSSTSSGTTSASTGSSSSGTGGSCTPSSTMACFDGMPPAMAGRGICVAGSQTCKPDGTGYGGCMGQVLPMPETCADLHDEDCDGNECALWAKLYGDGADQTVAGVAVDAMGNIIVAGTFAGGIAFDPAMPLSANGTQIYLAKLDPTGMPVWSKVFPSSGAVSVSGVAIGPNDSIFLTGTFANNANLNFGSGTLSTIDFVAGYVAKFTPLGVSAWSQPLDFDDVTNVTAPAIDSGGNVVLFGYQECGFSCQSHTNNLWLEKRGPAGAMTWHKSFFAAPATGTRSAGGVAVDPFDNILIAGSFAGTENLGGGNLASAGGFDGLVARFNSGGALLNSLVFGDGVNQAAKAIATDSAGDAFVTGAFAGKITYGGTKSITSAGGADMFVARIDTNSFYTATWMKAFGDAADQSGDAIAVPKLGTAEILVTGSAAGSIDFGNGALMSQGGVDIPVAKLDGAGMAKWSRLFGGMQSQAGTGIAYLPAGKSVLAGNVLNAIDVGTGPLTSVGKLDVLVGTFAP